MKGMQSASYESLTIDTMQRLYSADSMPLRQSSVCVQHRKLECRTNPCDNVMSTEDYKNHDAF